ncbi:MAG TPA: hypothetical protein ENJ56_08215 [Anaerolineae bacterium]|nr:hypothetical protein [Anaerolineae bacterium]
MTADLNWPDLQSAFLNGTWQKRHYLDLESGQVHIVTEATRAVLQDVYDEVGEERAGELLDSAELQQAHRIEMDSYRYRAIPVCGERMLNMWRDAFANDCEPAFRNLLWSALNQNNNGQFERLLLLESAEKVRWEALLAQLVHEQLSTWLDTLPR